MNAPPTPLVRQALQALGVKHLLFACQDASFPADASEDIARGSPNTKASARLFAFLEQLGFTGVQLGPQGQCSRGNPSPYDGTIFSRGVESIPLELVAAAGASEASLRAATAGAGATPRADHARAHDAMKRLLDEAFASGRRLRSDIDAFAATHAEWIDRDARFFATTDVDVARYVFGQMLAHEAHAALRERAAHHSLTLHADLQAGLSTVDAATWAPALMRGYVMGAPPSRTTAAGQPWGYPIVDPHVPSALALLRLRFDKTFREYDGVRVDHPHALVCPWVYRTGTGDDGEAVRRGARLFESPDLPDHSALAPLAIARADQIDRNVARHADGWVTSLDTDQVDRYAVALDLLVGTAKRYGRDATFIACEALSTMPFPLGRVLARCGLGRFRVVQKAKLDDPSDVYRPDNAQPPDWMMLGTHDTPSIWAVLRDMPAAQRERWAAHLTQALGRSSVAADPASLAHAMFAEMLACRAENAMVFFTDLFGYEERYNEPGTTSSANWSLRLPPDFERLYAERVARGAAIDLGLALAVALEAHSAADRNEQPDRVELSAALRRSCASGSGRAILPPS